MVLDNLGNSLKDAVKKLANAGKIDRQVIDEVVKDIQRAMIQADVNVRLVMKLSNQIKNRALTEAPPAGMDSKEHVLRIVYTELVNIVGKATPIALRRPIHGAIFSFCTLARFCQKPIRKRSGPKIRLHEIARVQAGQLGRLTLVIPQARQAHPPGFIHVAQQV